MKASFVLMLALACTQRSAAPAPATTVTTTADAAAPRLDHCRQHRLAAEERRFQVDVDDSVPCRLAHVLDECLANDPGVVDEDVDAAEAAQRLRCHRLHLGFTRSLALEVAPYEILVNAICPGPIATALGQQGWRDGADVQGGPVSEL